MKFVSQDCSSYVLDVDPFDFEDDAEFVVRIDGKRETGVFLRRPEVLALRDHLTDLLARGEDPGPVDPTPEPKAFEVGDVLLIDPEASCARYDGSLGSPVYFYDVTAVEVVAAQGEEGVHLTHNVLVKALDGNVPGKTQYVSPAYLEPYDTAPSPSAAPEPGQSWYGEAERVLPPVGALPLSYAMEVTSAVLGLVRA